jgi:hypothetical protein
LFCNKGSANLNLTKSFIIKICWKNKDNRFRCNSKMKRKLLTQFQQDGHEEIVFFYFQLLFFIKYFVLYCMRLKHHHFIPFKQYKVIIPKKYKFQFTLTTNSWCDCIHVSNLTFFNEITRNCAHITCFLIIFQCI